MNSINKNTAILIGEQHSTSFSLRDILIKSNITSIAETDDGYSAIKLILELGPELVIYDLELSKGCCLEIVERIRKMSMECVIIILSTKSNLLYAWKCIDIGANAVVNKESAVVHIATAINAAINGYVFYPFKAPRFSQKENISESDIKLDTLSLQEIKVFKNLLKGNKTSLIASEMNISDKTVSTYKRRMMKKLGCNSLTELYLFAVENKLKV